MYTEITTIKEIHTKVSPIIVPKTVIETSVITSTGTGTSLNTTTVTTTTTLNLIKFTIDDLGTYTYYAKENQTWEEWLNDSDFFNDLGWGDKEYKGNGRVFCIDNGYVKWYYDTTARTLYENNENNEIPATASILGTAYYHGNPYTTVAQANKIQGIPESLSE